MADLQSGTRQNTSARAQAIAFCGLSIALITVSAWVTVPLGPVPFTLQTFMILLVVLVLGARESLASIAGYIVIGAIGLPVFSGMRGGIGVLVGPTGGFIVGFIVGGALAVGVLVLMGWYRTPEGQMKAARAWTAAILAGVVYLVGVYTFGWGQLVVVSGMEPAAAFAVGVAPFLLLDACKTVAAIVIAFAVRKALFHANLIH